MTGKMINDAYLKFVAFGDDIPDDVLDFMKDAALEKLKGLACDLCNGKGEYRENGELIGCSHCCGTGLTGKLATDHFRESYAAKKLIELNGLGKSIRPFGLIDF